MKVIDNIVELRITLSRDRSESKKVGLVPTMGALHEGHVKLVEQSVNQNYITVCSIFINPTQFNSNEDLDKYPKRLTDDIDLLEKAGCDLVFVPSIKEMYPMTDVMHMSFGDLENVLEGEFRPNHFSGVGIIVSKLFNIVKADIAYFGQKDLQQVAIVKKMVADLNFDTRIVVVPTVREDNGLAMSSRNLRLTNNGKDTAVHLYIGLKDVKIGIIQGLNIEEVRLKVIKTLNQIEGFDLEYLEVVNSLTMQKVNNDIQKPEEISICGAAYVDGVRIIDNIYLKQKS